MLERVLAAIVLAVCVGLLTRLAIGARRRSRLDGAVRRLWSGSRRTAHGLWHWRAARRDTERARRLADETIRRARLRGTTREGNVIKPKSFRRPPRDKMH